MIVINGIIMRKGQYLHVHYSKSKKFSETNLSYKMPLRNGILKIFFWIIINNAINYDTLKFSVRSYKKQKIKNNFLISYVWICITVLVGQSISKFNERRTIFCLQNFLQQFNFLHSHTNNYDYKCGQSAWTLPAIHKRPFK